jgi:hypothetical protein
MNGGDKLRMEFQTRIKVPIIAMTWAIRVSVSVSYIESSLTVLFIAQVLDGKAEDLGEGLLCPFFARDFREAILIYLSLSSLFPALVWSLWLRSGSHESANVKVVYII